jgi:RimJ/RimL family protein N-acetyltransferase
MNSEYLDLTLRRASRNDSESLLIWRNDPTTRAFSLSGDEVALERHDVWLNKALNDNGCLLLIGEANGQMVGMVRINIFEDSTLGQVSINLNPKFRGKGISRRLLGESLANGKKVFDQILEYRADIHVNNFASQKIFKSLGFVKVSESPNKDFELYQLYSELLEISY